MKKLKRTIKRVDLLPKGVPVTNENIRIWAGLLTRRFQEERDPIVGLQTFHFCCEARIDVAPPILEWLNENIKEFLDRNGKTTLDSMMGLATAGRFSPFRSAIISERDEMLLMDVMRLKCHGCTLNSAVEMVLNRLVEAPNWNHTGWKLSSMGVNGLLQKYRRWAFRNEIEKEYRKNIMPNLTPKEVVAFYRKFPNYHDHLPQHQKILLKKYPPKA